MRIDVAGIPAPGLQIDLGLGAEWVREAGHAVLEASPTTLTGRLDVRRGRGKRVVVDGLLDASAPAVCDRCGDPTELRVHTETTLHYLPHRDELHAELELGVDDLDVGWYRQGQLEVANVVREMLALELPSRITCLDSAGCDARTQALLEQAGESTGGHPAFAALRGR